MTEDSGRVVHWNPASLLCRLFFHGPATQMFEAWSLDEWVCSKCGRLRFWRRIA